MKSTALMMLDFYTGILHRSRSLFEKRKDLCRSLQERLAQRHPEILDQPSQPLPRLDAADADRASFLEASNRLRRPVVISGLIAESRACREWNEDFFADHYGDSVYPTIADSRNEDPETKKNKVSLLTMRELLQSAREGNHAYINNLTKIFADHPKLLHDLEFGRVLKVLPPGETTDCFDLVNLFMGGKGTGTTMHSAFAGNFFCNIVGKKKWTLIDPKYTKYLLPMPAHPFIYSDVYYDPSDPERGQFTRRLPTFEVTLEPGDVLFNGPWWWHYVANPDGFTVACAVRRGNMAADYANNAIFSMMSWEPLLYLGRTLFGLQKRVTGDQRVFRDVLLSKLDGDIVDGLSEKEDKTEASLRRDAPHGGLPGAQESEKARRKRFDPLRLVRRNRSSRQKD